MQSLAELIPEDQVYDRFPGLFLDRELVTARKREEIAYYPRGRSIYYVEADLIAYIQSKKVKPACESNKPLDNNRDIPREFSRLDDTGSASKVVPMSTITTGTNQRTKTPADPRVERVIRQLESET